MRDLRFLYKTRYGTSRALIIGIDNYERISPLSYAVSDAEAIKKILVERFEFKEANVAFLKENNATKKNVLTAFARLTADDIDVDDRIIVFFAGHGHTRTGLRGEVGYLVPYDANTEDFSSFIRWDELTRNADLIRAKHILFIMDACYGGLALVRGGASGSTRFLRDMMLRSSRQVLTAGKADEVVADSGGPVPNHSVFTGHLIEALEGKALTPEGVLTASSIMAYVYANVANDKNSNQTPHYGHIDGDGDMVLIAPPFDSSESGETHDPDRLVSIPHFDIQEDVSRSSDKLRRAKELIAVEAGSIELHDLVISEVRRFLSLTSEDSFASRGTFSVQELVSRLERYQNATSDLATLLACIAHWGRGSHISTLEKAIARSCDRLESVGGLTTWLALRWFPMIMELYSAGIAAVDARRYDCLAAVFRTSIVGSEYPPINSFIEAASDAMLEINRSNIPKAIPGHEKNYTPLSEYLHKILQPQLEDAFFLGKNYDAAFDEFEIHFALGSVDANLVKDNYAWGPVGRFGWKHMRAGEHAPLRRLLREADALKKNWPPILAGMYGGSYERFERAAASFSKDVDNLRWY